MMFNSHKQHLSSPKLCHCKLCSNTFSPDDFLDDLGICKPCGVKAQSYVFDSFLPFIKDCEQSANERSEPDAKLVYLSLILDRLYEYKYNYQEKDIHLIDGDIDDTISKIIDTISRIRE